MDADSNQILAAVKRCLEPEEIKSSCIYWHKKHRFRGETISSGPQTLVVPFNGTLVFVDLAPRTNWAHPCLYIFIDSPAARTEVKEASFPPGINPADESYIILFRYGKKPPDEHYFNVFDK